MQKLIVKNFGPIKDVELDVNDFMVFIGPQASGKSTLSKAIYFFNSLRDDLINFILECIAKKNFDRPLAGFSRKIRQKHLDYWGTTQHLKDIYLRFDYKPGIWLEITLTGEESYINPHYSKEFITQFTSLISDSERFLGNQSNNASPQIIIEASKNEFTTQLVEKANLLFANNRELRFVPAGRSLLSVLSNQIQFIDDKKIDFLTRGFIQRIGTIRDFFSKPLKSIIEEWKLEEESMGLDLSRGKLAEKIIELILKGRYISDKEGEKLFIKDESYIKLNFASSGQQESLWILLLIFLHIIRNYPTLMAIEEPEAHLYPDAQQYITELIVLLANNKRNQIILTTHSPYILAAINNLIYAYKVGVNNSSRVNEIIEKRLWLNPIKIGCYHIDNGRVRDIMDRESQMIRNEEMDTASGLINSAYDKIADIEFQK